MNSKSFPNATPPHTPFMAHCVVKSNERLNELYHLIRLSWPQEYASAMFVPGSFVQLKAQVQGVLLRRPISVMDYDDSTSTMELLIQRVGKATNYFCDLQSEEELDVIGPLGKGFNTNLTPSGGVPLLVGGGVGMAPLLMLARRFAQQGIRPQILVGARSANLLVLQRELQEVGELFVTTDDGSRGVHGTVLQHPVFGKREYDAVYTCGPRPMMKALAQALDSSGIPVEVSLENSMACGIGACLCCVTPTKHQGNRCVCTEGPVFNATDILW